MSALEEANKLKTRRRAELAEAERAAREADAAREREAEECLNRCLRAALDGAGVSWLYQHRVGEPNIWRRSAIAEIRFEIPGHRGVYVRLRRTRIEPDQWILSSADFEDGAFTWAAANIGDTFPDRTFSDLADALIEAEIEGWTPAAPPLRPEPSPETRHAAERAWAAMTQAEHPLPPGPALDLVQDAGGERDDAVSALHVAAAEWLDRLRPEQPVEGEVNSASLSAAIACRGHLLGEGYSLAENCRLEVEALSRQVQDDYYQDPEDGLFNVDDHNHASNWLFWCGEARHAIGLCQQLSAAAHPAEAA